VINGADCEPAPGFKTTAHPIVTGPPDIIQPSPASVGKLPNAKVTGQGEQI